MSGTGDNDSGRGGGLAGLTENKMNDSSEGVGGGGAEPLQTLGFQIQVKKPRRIYAALGC